MKHFFPNITKFAAVIGLVVSLLVPTLSADAATVNATYSLSPSSGSVTVGSTITVNVILFSGGNTISAIQPNLTYSTSVFSLESFSVASGSPFTSSVGSDAIGGGTIRLARYTTTASTYSGPVTTIVLKAIAAGTGSLTFDPICANDDCAAAIANDNFGTNVLSSTSNGSYTASAPAAPPPSGGGSSSGGSTGSQASTGSTTTTPKGTTSTTTKKTTTPATTATTTPATTPTTTPATTPAKTSETTTADDTLPTSVPVAVAQKPKRNLLVPGLAVGTLILGLGAAGFMFMKKGGLPKPKDTFDQSSDPPLQPSPTPKSPLPTVFSPGTPPTPSRPSFMPTQSPVQPPKSPLAHRVNPVEPGSVVKPTATPQHTIQT